MIKPWKGVYVYGNIYVFRFKRIHGILRYMYTHPGERDA